MMHISTHNLPSRPMTSYAALDRQNKKIPLRRSVPSTVHNGRDVVAVLGIARRWCRNVSHFHSMARTSALSKVMPRIPGTHRRRWETNLDFHIEARTFALIPISNSASRTWIPMMPRFPGIPSRWSKISLTKSIDILDSTKLTPIAGLVDSRNGNQSQNMETFGI